MTHIPQPLDIIAVDSSLNDIPKVLIDCYRQIVYRLKQVNLYDNDNDIRLYVPHYLLKDFVDCYISHFAIEAKRDIINGFITLDSRRVTLQEYNNDKGIIFLVVIRSGKTELVSFDEILARNLFRVPWAIAAINMII